MCDEANIEGAKLRIVEIDDKVKSLLREKEILIGLLVRVQTRKDNEE
jgi:hypothetical protein